MEPGNDEASEGQTQSEKGRERGVGKRVGGRRWGEEDREVKEPEAKKMTEGDRKSDSGEKKKSQRPDEQRTDGERGQDTGGGGTLEDMGRGVVRTSHTARVTFFGGGDDGEEIVRRCGRW